MGLCTVKALKEKCKLISSLAIFYVTGNICDMVALLAGRRTCNSQVVGSSHGWAPLHSGLGHATYTCVPLSVIC